MDKKELYKSIEFPHCRNTCKTPSETNLIKTRILLHAITFFLKKNYWHAVNRKYKLTDVFGALKNVSTATTI